MSYLSKKEAVQRMKKYYKTIGKRSINDIIKLEDMDFKAKVNFIRHNYTYYNGNESLFYKANKKTPNEKREQLDNLIKAVILGKYSSDILKKFDKEIMKWRKAKLEKERKLQLKKEASHTKNNEDKKAIKMKIALSDNEIYNWFKNLSFCKSININSIKFANDCQILTIAKLFLQHSNVITTSNELYNLTAHKVFKKARIWYSNNIQTENEFYDKENESIQQFIVANYNERKNIKDIKAFERFTERYEENYEINKLREYDQYIKSKNLKEVC